MLQDISRGAPTEIEAISGAVVRYGRQVGVSTPVNEFLWRAIKNKENVNSLERFAAEGLRVLTK
jgi:2-dehydropantoate 2-reductase